MTTLIKNGLLYVGTVDVPEKLDVLIQDDRIVRVGFLQKVKADNVIDATGAIVCPGFIDVNTHSDHYFSIFSNPLQEDFLKNGITTIIGGNCGESLAPFSFTRKSVITDWGHSHVSSTNIHWHDVRELFRILKNKKFGVNFGTLVGYTTIRNFVTGGVMRDLTDSESLLIEDILSSALEGGVLGLSSGFEHAHEEHIPKREISNLFEILKNAGGIYATHIKNSDGYLFPSLEETLEMTRGGQIKTEISHLIPIRKREKEFTQVLKKMEEEMLMNNIHFDFPIFSRRVIPIHYFLPPWIHDETLEKILSHIVTPHLKKMITNHFSQFDAKNIFITTAPKHLSSLVGKSLRDISKSFGMTFGNTLLYLMQISHLGILCRVGDIDEAMLQSFLFSPVSIISSSRESLSKNEFMSEPQENLCSRIQFLSKKYSVAMERIISKLTSIPASVYGIRRRGCIKEGYYADVVVMKDGAILDVFVNGVRSIREGVVERNLGGRTIYRS